MFPRLACRVLSTTDPRLVWKFIWNFGVKGVISVQKFKRQLRRGESFPAFLYISIINSCNLRCQGCWVDVEAEREMIDLDTFNTLISDAKRHGRNFFGILGGEPFMHPQWLEMLASHPDCYFQIFTNGQFITEKVAEDLRRLGNATPLISIEGKRTVSDERRGKKDVFDKTMRGLENCLRARLLTGVATSVCQSNIDELLTESWLEQCIQLGVHYVWYHSYRPVGPKMNQQLALRPDQLMKIREFIVAMRSRMPIAIIDAYYDHRGQALCPMATGISHHISPRGEVEPCPIIQFAAENIRDPRGAFEAVRSSAFLRDFRETAKGATRGCLLLERPDLMKELVLKHRARDSTVRGTALAELDAMTPRFSQWLPGREIPERHWMYWLVKRCLFNDFGAYRNSKHDVRGRRQALEAALEAAGPQRLDAPARDIALKSRP
jgi:MoaA/NifB/PqqE/SkfB family radical SAM enzyme